MESSGVESSRVEWPKYLAKEKSETIPRQRKCGRSESNFSFSPFRSSPKSEVPKRRHLPSHRLPPSGPACAAQPQLGLAVVPYRAGALQISARKTMSENQKHKHNPSHGFVAFFWKSIDRSRDPRPKVQKGSKNPKLGRRKVEFLRAFLEVQGTKRQPIGAFLGAPILRALLSPSHSGGIGIWVLVECRTMHPLSVFGSLFKIGPRSSQPF